MKDETVTDPDKVREQMPDQVVKALENLGESLPEGCLFLTTLFMPDGRLMFFGNVEQSDVPSVMFHIAETMTEHTEKTLTKDSIPFPANNAVN